MKRFVEGTDRGQSTLFPECLEDWIDENNPVQVIDVFVDELDLAELGFDGVAPETTGRPSYHPSVLLKLYIYGYLNRVQSSRRLEREAGRNVEVMWLTGRLGFDTNQARWQLLKECQYIATLELTTEDDIALGTDAVDLENRWPRSKSLREEAIQYYKTAIFDVSSFNEIYRKHIAHDDAILG